MVAKAEQAGETPKDRVVARLHTAPPKAFTPLFNDVCIHLFEETDVKSGGGVYIPDASADNWANRIGVVLAVGPACEYAEEGDLVIVKEVLLTEMARTPVKAAMPQVRYNNVTYHLIPEWMIAGKL